MLSRNKLVILIFGKSAKSYKFGTSFKGVRDSNGMRPRTAYINIKEDELSTADLYYINSCIAPMVKKVIYKDS